jgi:hypothetical protein
MHLLQFCCLDGVVGVEGVRDPMVVIVVSTMCYLHFVSYASMLASFSMVVLYWWRLSSCIFSWVSDDVWLGASGIGYVIGDVASVISDGIGWRIGRSIGCSVGSRVDWLHYFVFTSSLFSH